MKIRGKWEVNGMKGKKKTNPMRNINKKNGKQRFCYLCNLQFRVVHILGLNLFETNSIWPNEVLTRGDVESSPFDVIRSSSHHLAALLGTGVYILPRGRPPGGDIILKFFGEKL